MGENKIRTSPKVYLWLTTHKKSNHITSLNGVVRKLIKYWIEGHKTKPIVPQTEDKEAV